MSARNTKVAESSSNLFQQEEATGPDGAFDDPETATVESFSSRGPCIVNGEVRSKPTTCAADRLTTSTPGGWEIRRCECLQSETDSVTLVTSLDCYDV